MEYDDSPIDHDGALELEDSFGDGTWFSIQRVGYLKQGYLQRDPRIGGRLSFSVPARISDASVEGPPDQMVALARAIQERRSESFRRCAVQVDGDKVLLWSPRNSMRPGRVPLAIADALAELIIGRLGDE